jgi:guanylate kinase
LKGTDPTSSRELSPPRPPGAVAGRGVLFVLSGPSGVGKDAVLHALLGAGATAPWVGGICKCVTATTRAPRAGEVDGVDYHFWDIFSFKQQVEQDALLEWADVFGHLYGTPRRWVDDQLAEGEDVILKIDVQGGLQVKERRPDAVLIFLLPPSRAELERRLRQRYRSADRAAAEGRGVRAGSGAAVRLPGSQRQPGDGRRAGRLHHRRRALPDSTPGAPLAGDMGGEITWPNVHSAFPASR